MSTVPSRTLVFDFDGTLTNVSDVAEAFLHGFCEELRAELQLSNTSFDTLWQEALARVQASPSHYGWVHEGKIVAPAQIDPFILANCVGNLVAKTVEPFASDEPQRMQLLGDMYRRVYPRIHTPFREDVQSVFASAFLHFSHVCIVTNSRGDVVQNRVETAFPEVRGRLRVIGDARKFILCDPEKADSRFAALAESASIDGLDRPLYVRRGLYFQRLREAMQEREFESLHVIGDVLELDLYLPWALGAHVCLVQNSHSCDYEVNAMKQMPRAYVAQSLSEALGYFLKP